MAEKTHYKYTEYSFSPEATRYSKKLCDHNNSRSSALIFSALIIFIAVSIVGSSVISGLNSKTAVSFVLLLALLLSITGGFKIGSAVNKKIETSYIKRINSALLRDLKTNYGDKAEEMYDNLKL